MQKIIATVSTRERNRSIGNTNLFDTTELELTIVSTDIWENPTFELHAQKADGNFIRQLDGITIVDKTNKIIKVQLNSDIVTCTGIVAMQLLIKENGRTSTSLFYINVNRSLDREIIQSIQNVKVLEDLDKYVETAYANLKEYEQRLTQLETSNAEMNRQEAIRQQQEEARQLGEQNRNTTFTQSQEVRTQEFNQAEVNRTESYNRAETNRDNVYISKEVERDSLYKTSEANRDNLYKTAETSRNDSFNNAETARQNTFTVSEATRQSSEEERIILENNRKKAEEVRISNESIRVKQETDRVASMKSIEDKFKVIESNTKTTIIYKNRIVATEGQTTFNLDAEFNNATDALIIQYNNLLLEETINYTVSNRVVSTFPLGAGDVISYILVKCTSPVPK